MSNIDQVLAVARALEASGKVPSLALIKTRLGNSLPLPILIQGLQQFKAMPKAERERLAELIITNPIAATADTNEALTLMALSARLIAQQQHFEHYIQQQNTEIVQLKNELLVLKERISLLESQGKNGLMFVTELRFECFADTTISAAEKAINQLLEAYRANGQILGREFAVAFNDGEFRVRLLLPEKSSLAHKYHSPWVKKALAELTEAKLLAPREKFIGQDINSEVSNTETPSWQLLYTSYVHMCSPLRSGDNLLPIPLYRLPATFNGDHKRIIRWQSEWQACDELQMAAATKAEFAALEELSSPDSDLFRRGWDLRGRIEYLTKIPTYYYLYRVGGQDLASEMARPCPRCGNQHWKLDEPLLDIFHFRCEPCRIVSNLSWDHQ